MRDPVSQAEVASLGASGASLEEEGCGQAEKGNPASSQFLLWKPLETLPSLLSCLHGSTLLTPGTAYLEPASHREALDTSPDTSLYPTASPATCLRQATCWAAAGVLGDGARISIVGTMDSGRHY